MSNDERLEHTRDRPDAENTRGLSRREFLLSGVAVVVGGAAVAGVAVALNETGDSAPTNTLPPTQPATADPPAVLKDVPRARTRWGLRHGTEGWRPGVTHPGTEVTQADGWLRGTGQGTVEVASFAPNERTRQDWRLADRPNDDRVSLTANVQGDTDKATLVVTMTWVTDGRELASADSFAFQVPTGRDIDVDTWWDCRGTAPRDVLERVIGVAVTAKSDGAVDLRIRDVRQPPTTEPYGPAAHGVARVFTATAPNNLPPATAKDPFAAKVLARLDALGDWAQTNHRAVHIGEWAWPKEVGGEKPQATPSQQGWGALAEQWMRKADALAIPYTPWGESAYWAGDRTATGVNYGSYPDASFFCAEDNYRRTGDIPRTVNARKPSARPLIKHFNAVSGIAPSINVIGGCFTKLRDGSEYSATNIGQRGSDYFVESPATIDYLHSAGYRIFRMPFRWDRVMRSPDAATLDPDEWGYVKEGIEHILSLPDTAVIVDQHSAAQFWISPDPIDKSAPATQYVVDGPDGRLRVADFVHFWELVSTSLAYYSDRLIFEITNEPHGDGANPFSVKRYTQAVVTALRARGDKTFLLIPSFPFDNIVQSLTEGNHPFPWIEDPAGSNRHAYTFHAYMDGEMSGRYAKSYQEEVASAT